MAEITVSELRKHGGEVIDRVERGERLTITRSGKPVAELLPLRPMPLHATTLIARGDSVWSIRTACTTTWTRTSTSPSDRN